MIQFALPVLLAGLASYALLCLFLALVPRLAGERKSVVSFLLQYLLILVLVVPAIAAAIFGPSLLIELTANESRTENQNAGLIVVGSVLLVGCLIAALRSPAGRRYTSWRSRVA
jgi:hypothetical protein